MGVGSVTLPNQKQFLARDSLDVMGVGSVTIPNQKQFLVRDSLDAMGGL